MNWSSDSRGRKPADRGGHNPRSRRAVCEQHKYGSVRGAPSDGGSYSMAALEAGGVSAAEYDAWVDMRRMSGPG